MKKITGLMFVLLAALLLTTAGTGCTAKARLAYHLQKADQAFDAGDYDKAEIEYINALRKDHENAHAIGRLGTVYFNEGKLLKAAPFLLKGCEVDTNNLDLHLKLGSFYLVAGRQKDARDEADFVLARNPQDNKAPLLLVAAVDTQKALADTKLQLETLVQKGDGAALEVALASVALRSGDFKKAETHLNRAETLDPKLSAVWSVKAGFYLVQSNRVEAESALKKAAELAPDRSSEKVQYAEFKAQTGDPAGGRHLLEEMVRKTPDYVPAWMALVNLAAAEKKYDDCDSLLTKLLARDPDNYNALMTSGRLDLSQGKIAEAAATFERMSKIFAQAPSVHFQMAVAYLAQTNTDKAITSLNRAIALNTNYPEAILLLDQIEVQRGNADAVIPSLKKLAQQYPQAFPVQLLLADAFRAEGRSNDALVIYRQLQTMSPTNSQIQLLMGTVLLQQNKNAEARNAFTRALELAPDNFAALEQLVNLDVMEKHYAVATQRVQSQIAKNPGLAALQILQAQIFMAQDDSKQAEAVLLKLVATEPDNVTAHMLLARLYLDSKQPRKALAELKIVSDKNPKNEAALLISGMTYNDEKDYKAARDIYEKLLLVNPKSTAALNNLAYLYSEFLDDLGRAYLLAQQAKDLNPNDPSSTDTLGWILCKRGQYLLAIDLLQGSANQLPNEPEVQFHLGWAQYMMGQESAAKQTLEHALQLGKTFRGQQECEDCLAVLKVDPKNAGTNGIAYLEKRLAAQPADSVAMLRLASIYQREGATDKALAMYEAALKINPNSVPSLINLAQLYAAKKNPQKALEMAKLAYRMAPDNSQASLILGRLAYETGDYKLSVNLLQNLAFNQATNPEVLFDYAKAGYAMGQVSDAQTAMRSALQLGGSFIHADEAKRFLNLTTLAADLPKAQDQATQIESILKSEPDYVPALMVMAGLQNEKNDSESAMLAYKNVIKKYPDFSPAYKDLAVLCSQSIPSDPQATDFAAKARSAYPDDLTVAKALGIILYQKADYAKAERILKECISQMPADPILFYYLGMTQYQLQKPLDCKKNLQQALNLNLPGQFTQAAKKVLLELK